LTQDQLKSKMQAHLGDGLVLIVGSGLSCAEGMPGMAQLQAHLRAIMPSRASGTDLALWNSIESLLDSVGLEGALLQIPPSTDLEVAIMGATTDLLMPKEAQIIAEVVSGARQLRFSRLIPHLLKPNSGIPVVTTNYDRLVEFAAEVAGMGVDTMFVGTHCGKVNENESRWSFCRKGELKGKTVRFFYKDRILLFKPHGSLDWYQRGNEPMRSSIELSLPRLIITPGLNKFRNGYENPFDRHRDRANAANDDRNCARSAG